MGSVLHMYVPPFTVWERYDMPPRDRFELYAIGNPEWHGQLIVAIRHFVPKDGPVMSINPAAHKYEVLTGLEARMRFNYGGEVMLTAITETISPMGDSHRNSIRKGRGEI